MSLSCSWSNLSHWLLSHSWMATWLQVQCGAQVLESWWLLNEHFNHGEDVFSLLTFRFLASHSGVELSEDDNVSFLVFVDLCHTHIGSLIWFPLIKVLLFRPSSWTYHRPKPKLCSTVLVAYWISLQDIQLLAMSRWGIVVWIQHEQRKKTWLFRAYRGLYYSAM